MPLLAYNSLQRSVRCLYSSCSLSVLRVTLIFWLLVVLPVCIAAIEFCLMLDAACQHLHHAMLSLCTDKAQRQALETAAAFISANCSPADLQLKHLT